MTRRLTAAERETVITMCDAGDRAWVHSEQRPMIRNLRKIAHAYPAHVEIIDSRKTPGGSPMIEVELPAEFVSVRPSRSPRYRNGAQDG